MDPILFTLDIGFTQLIVRWYGLLVVAGTLSASYFAAWYIKRKGQDPNLAWDMMIWLLISGVIGARIWYVTADIIGGNTRYLDDPISMLYIHQGGLNILGGVVVGAIVGWYFARRSQVDFWLLADAIGPGYLIGQAIGRIGNFINQELYGPPTTLPWGLSIEASHRIPPWNDLTLYPVETTRFHPTFFYEMIWNLLFAAFLTYLIIKHSDKLKAGVIAGSWLVITGVGRALLEISLRPDQPSFFGLGVTTSMVLSIAFALIGLFIILVKMGKIEVPFMASGTEQYEQKRPVRRPPGPRKVRH